MAFDDQDRVNHTDTENRSEEHPTAKEHSRRMRKQSLQGYTE